MNLSGRLPPGNANGLDALVRLLCDTPKALHVVVALLDCTKVTEHVDDGAKVPTLRIRRIEAITDREDAERLMTLMRREYERRTGQEVLPFELEQDLRAVFDDPAASDSEEQPDV